MDKPVLVDSSVWIAYFRKQESVFDEINLLAENKRICLIGMILAELYQGCKSQKEIGVIRDLSEVFPRLDETADMWEEAGMLSFKLRRQGKSPGLADCYIAVTAKKFGALIYSFDKHFVELAKAHKIKLYSPE